MLAMARRASPANINQEWLYLRHHNSHPWHCRSNPLTQNPDVSDHNDMMSASGEVPMVLMLSLAASSLVVSCCSKRIRVLRRFSRSFCFFAMELVATRRLSCVSFVSTMVDVCPAVQLLQNRNLSARPRCAVETQSMKENTEGV